MKNEEIKKEMCISKLQESSRLVSLASFATYTNT